MADDCEMSQQLFVEAERVIFGEIGSRFGGFGELIIDGFLVQQGFGECLTLLGFFERLAMDVGPGKRQYHQKYDQTPHSAIPINEGILDRYLGHGSITGLGRPKGTRCVLSP